MIVCRRRAERVRLALPMMRRESPFRDQFICDKQGGHQHEPFVANMAYVRAQRVNFGFDDLSESYEVIFLAVIADEAIGPVIECDRYLPHSPPKSPVSPLH
jgi:hypothetical protein